MLRTCLGAVTQEQVPSARASGGVTLGCVPRLYLVPLCYTPCSSMLTLYSDLKILLIKKNDHVEASKTLVLNRMHFELLG